MADPTERIYILEVASRPILAFSAASLQEARQLPKEAWLIQDLAELKSNGKPIWTDGTTMSVRQASEDQQAAFAEGREQSDKTEDLVLVYLIDLDD